MHTDDIAKPGERSRLRKRDDAHCESAFAVGLQMESFRDPSSGVAPTSNFNNSQKATFPDFNLALHGS